MMFCRCDECLAAYQVMAAMSEEAREEFERTMPEFTYGFRQMSAFQGAHVHPSTGEPFLVAWIEPVGHPAGWHWRESEGLFLRWKGPFSTSCGAYDAACMRRPSFVQFSGGNRETASV